jgi:hypothetical protein
LLDLQTFGAGYARVRRIWHHATSKSVFTCRNSRRHLH